MDQRQPSIEFSGEIPIDLQAQTLAHAIIDKLQHLLSKQRHNKNVETNELDELYGFSYDLKQLITNQPQHFNASEQDFIIHLFERIKELAQTKQGCDSNELIILEANAETLLTELQRNE